MKRIAYAVPVVLVLVLVTGIAVAWLVRDDGAADPRGPSGHTDGNTDGRTDTDREVGTLVATWSEADHPRDRLPEPPDPDGRIETDAERDRWLATFDPALDPALDVTAVAAADLDAGLLLVGAYAKCDKVGVVVADGDEVRWSTWVPQQFACAWAPWTVEVWYVADDELD